jgi:hypothetical protein
MIERMGTLFRSSVVQLGFGQLNASGRCGCACRSDSNRDGVLDHARLWLAATIVYRLIMRVESHLSSRR